MPASRLKVLPVVAPRAAPGYPLPVVLLAAAAAFLFLFTYCPYSFALSPRSTFLPCLLHASPQFSARLSAFLFADPCIFRGCDPTRSTLFALLSAGHLFPSRRATFFSGPRCFLPLLCLVCLPLLYPTPLLFFHFLGRPFTDTLILTTLFLAATPQQSG